MKFCVRHCGSDQWRRRERACYGVCSADGVQVVRRPEVVFIGVQPLLFAAAAPADDDAATHPRPHGHRPLPSLPQVRLRQQDVRRLLRSGDSR